MKTKYLPTFWAGRDTQDKAVAYAKSIKLNWNRLTADEKRMVLNSMEKNLRK